MNQPYQKIALELSTRPAGTELRLRISGDSMAPLLQSGEAVIIAPIQIQDLKIGDLVTLHRQGQPVTHRLLAVKTGGNLVTRGDNSRIADPACPPGQLLGRVVAFERNAKRVPALTSSWRGINRLLGWLGARSLPPNPAGQGRVIPILLGIPVRHLARFWLRWETR